MNGKTLIATCSLLMVAAVSAVLYGQDAFAPQAAAPDITVYKDPQCGCCGKWIEHLRRSGFSVAARNETRMDRIKSARGVPARLASCHTAVVGGYVIEGHVPADAIKRLLRERPPISGLAVPGMPMGAPGMEGPRTDRYEIASFGPDGKIGVYERR